MITRRAALKTLALSSGAMALAGTARAQQPPAEADSVFKLPPLGYNYNALEPFIDAETMKLHHDKHHAAYVSKLNQAAAKLPKGEKRTLDELLANLEAVPAEVRGDIRDQGGGHANHSLFWLTLKKNEGGKPAGGLGKEIVKGFGSYDDFWNLFASAALGVFGSGWTWLVLRDRKLAIEQTANQDSPLMNGAVPLLGIDVWEHAYYLKYQNRRAEYVAAFQNVINWEFVGERFAKYSP